MDAMVELHATPENQGQTTDPDRGSAIERGLQLPIIPGPAQLFLGLRRITNMECSLAIFFQPEYSIVNSDLFML